MPDRDTEAHVKPWLLMLSVIMMLLHHSDARPVVTCRLATTDGKRQLLLVATTDACTFTAQQTQQPPETVGDVATLKSPAVHQVT